MYTANGNSIRNLESYMSAGGKPRNSAGDIIQNPVAYRNTIEASVRQNTNNPKYLFHYTTNDAAASIGNGGGTIRASSSGLDGSGTYLTAKPPRCNTDTLLNNNYGTTTGRGSNVQNYVRLNADSLDAQRVTSAGPRDVWKVNGDVNLHDHGGYIAERNTAAYGHGQASGGAHSYHGGYGGGYGYDNNEDDGGYYDDDDDCDDFYHY